MEKFQRANAAKAILPPSEFHSLTGKVRRKYLGHKRAAANRGIGWEFTFESWCRVWHESGRWSLRGAGRGKYVMGRFGDIGPYSPTNVAIILFSQNVEDGKGRLGGGRGWHVDKRDKDARYFAKVGKSIVGRFDTKEESQEAYRRSCELLAAEKKAACNPAS